MVADGFVVTDETLDYALMTGNVSVVQNLLDNAPELVQRMQRFHPKAARRLINDARIRQVWGMYQFD